MNKSIIRGALTIFFAASLSPAQAQNSSAAPVVTKQLNHVDEQFVSGRVRRARDLSSDGGVSSISGISSRKQLVEVEVNEGPLSGRRFITQNEITDNPAYNISVKPGQEIILSIVTADGGAPEVNISDYKRSPALGWLAAVFLGAFLIFGGKQGVKSLLGLGAVVSLIAFVLLPLSLQGFNPLATAVGICVAAAAVTMILICGLSRKALAAIIGTVGGVIISGVAAQIVIQTAPLTGLSTEEAQILRGSILNQPIAFYPGLLAAGMLIGALGVIMDIGVSIASAVHEVSRANSRLSARALYESGMNVGRDIMGTMTTTLALAYAGGALPLLLLVARAPSMKLLNLDLVATEVAATLTGSLGLVCAIPLTALAAARLMQSAGAAERRSIANEELMLPESRALSLKD